jgi:hypothetical protein
MAAHCADNLCACRERLWIARHQNDIRASGGESVRGCRTKASGAASYHSDPTRKIER